MFHTHSCIQDVFKPGPRAEIHAPLDRALLPHAYLVEVFACGSHLLPGFIQQLDADAEEFLEGAVVREEHGVEVVAVFAGCGESRECQATPLRRP